MELSPSSLFPESDYKKKKAVVSSSSDKIEMKEIFSEEDVLFWSSAGIPDEQEAN